MAQPGTESIWLWVGTAGMAIGALYFLALGWNVEREEEREYFAITAFIPAVAAAAYFAMATGFGLVEVEVAGRTLDIYWARYADWLITTPLLLLDLALLAGADRTTIGTLIGIDVYMIVTGLVATLAAEPAFRIAWWGISSGAFLVLLYFLLGSLTQQASVRAGDVSALFRRLRNLTAVLWTAYPVVWLLGTESTLAILPLYWETAAFMVLDLAAKVGFGLILLRSRSVIRSAARPVGEPTTA